MKFKIVTDGTTSQLLDADGKPVHIDGAIVTADLAGNQPLPETDAEKAKRTELELADLKAGKQPAPRAVKNSCTIKILIRDAELIVAENCKAPFEWHSHNVTG